MASLAGPVDEPQVIRKALESLVEVLS